MACAHIKPDVKVFPLAYFEEDFPREQKKAHPYRYALAK